jgi:hypothetical protein
MTSAELLAALKASVAEGAKRAAPCEHVYESAAFMACMFCGHELGAPCDGCGERDGCRCEETDRKIRDRLEQERDA